MLFASFATTNSPCDLVAEQILSSKHWLPWIGNLSIHRHERTCYCYVLFHGPGDSFATGGKNMKPCLVGRLLPLQALSEMVTLIGWNLDESGTPSMKNDRFTTEEAFNHQSWGMGLNVFSSSVRLLISSSMMVEYRRLQLQYPLQPCDVARSQGCVYDASSTNFSQIGECAHQMHIVILSWKIYGSSSLNRIS